MSFCWHKQTAEICYFYYHYFLDKNHQILNNQSLNKFANKFRSCPLTTWVTWSLRTWRNLRLTKVFPISCRTSSSLTRRTLAWKSIICLNVVNLKFLKNAWVDWDLIDLLFQCIINTLNVIFVWKKNFLGVRRWIKSEVRIFLL